MEGVFPCLEKLRWTGIHPHATELLGYMINGQAYRYCFKHICLTLVYVYVCVPV